MQTAKPKETQRIIFSHNKAKLTSPTTNSARLSVKQIEINTFCLLRYSI